eukprot:1191079-Prorocentrum_minimum.AAC.3
MCGGAPPPRPAGRGPAAALEGGVLLALDPRNASATLGHFSSASADARQCAPCGSLAGPSARRSGKDSAVKIVQAAGGRSSQLPSAGPRASSTTLVREVPFFLKTGRNSRRWLLRSNRRLRGARSCMTACRSREYWTLEGDYKG